MHAWPPKTVNKLTANEINSKMDSVFCKGAKELLEKTSSQADGERTEQLKSTEDKLISSPTPARPSYTGDIL